MAKRTAATVAVKLSEGLVPGPPRRWLVGNTLQFVKGITQGIPANNAYGFIREWHDKYGDLVYIDSAGLRNTVLVSSPEIIKYIVRNDPARFTKGPSYDSIQRGWLDGTLVVNEGEEWRAKRSVYSRAFRLGAIRTYVPIFMDIAENTADQWQQHYERNEHIDAVECFASVAFEAIGQAGFGVKGLGGKDNKYSEAFVKYLEALSKELGLMQLLPKQLKNLITRSRGQAHLDQMCSEAARIVSAASSASGANGTSKTLVRLMREAIEEEGVDLSPEQLAREANLFLFAGHDTTSATLAWATAMLAKCPDSQQRLFEEVSMVPPEEMQQKLEDPKSLPFLNAVIKETLRLQGPAPMVTRLSKCDEEFNGFSFPPGTNFVPSISAVHRDPVVFEDANAFLPQRWLEGDVAKLKRMQDHWIPFMAGARGCIGQLFAQTELRVVLATLIKRFHIDIVSSPKQLVRMLVLPSNVHLKVRPR